MRLVICGGVQYDADNLPAHLEAKDCVPADKWFARHRKTGATAPTPEPDPEPTATRRTSKRRSQ